MTPDEFDGLVTEAYARIPARFRRRLKNVALLVEAEPSRGNSRTPAWPPDTRCSVSMKAGL